MPVAFVIRPFNVKKDSAGTPLDFDRVYSELILPALQQCGIPGGDMGEIVGPGNIREDMFAKIIEAELVICDVSIHNANVFTSSGFGTRCAGSARSSSRAVRRRTPPPSTC
jgi:hypothetical protein